MRRTLLQLLAVMVTALSLATPSIGFMASDSSATGSRATDDEAWRTIRRSLMTAIELARQGGSEGLTAIQRQAVYSLEQMGWTESEASTIVAGLEKGGTAAEAVGRAADRDYSAYGASGGGMAARSDAGPRGHEAAALPGDTESGKGPHGKAVKILH